MKNHHEVGHFKNRLMIVLLSLCALVVTAGQSFAATTCSTCHGMPPLDSSDGSRQSATGAFKGNHQTHVSASGAVAECTKCHNSSGYTNAHAVTNSFNISLSSNIFNSPSTAKYSKGSSFPQTATPTLGSCRNVSCHFENVTPQWGTSPALTNCNTCHATPRGASGSHLKHETAYGGLSSCAQCHPNYGSSSFNHATSAGKHKIVMNTFLTYSGGTTVSWLPSQADAFGTCRAAACHDTGRDNPRTPAWNTTKANCTACHALQPATFAHAKHLTGISPANFSVTIACTNCHKGYIQGSALSAAPADHLDGNVDVSYLAANDLGYGANKAKGSAVSSCSSM